MPAPTTVDEFMDLIRKSGVVDEKRLTAHIDRMRGQGQLPSEPVRLATQLVRDGVLTHFQAEQFLQGKWRRFTIGKYKVLERLGAGGMGSVYLCEHTLMRRRVAVKVLPANKAGDSSSLERFYREARAVAALDHPNIVRAYDIDQDENLHFLVMEHVDGASLQEVIKRVGPIDPIRTAHYIRQAALGLQHAHETAGLVHRDIKPGNVLVDRNGIVKILDMGLARFFHDEEDVLTKKYDENVLGTADYLAPEQALDSHSVDIRADIYSLGGTFYFCLTGRTPFSEGSVAQKLIWHQTRQPKPVTSIRADVPEGLLAVLERMMAKKPDDRYQTPQEVADALSPWTQTQIPPPPENEMPQLSLAAMRGPMTETGMSSAKPSTEPAPPIAPSRKQWQVSAPVVAPPAPTVTTPAPTSTGGNTKPAMQPPAPVPVPVPIQPVAPRPAPQPVPVQRQPAPQPVITRPATPKPVAKAAPVPVPALNGQQQARGAVAAPAREMSPVEADSSSAEIDDLDVSDERPRGPRRAKEPRKKSGKGLWLWLILGLVVLIGAGVGLWWTFRTEDKPAPKNTTREPIKVPAGGSLTSALRGARDGDKIILQGDITAASISITQQNLTIEAEEGKAITWKCPANVDPGTKLLMLQAVQNFTMRGNITLDGTNQPNVEALIMLYARCPGTKLEKLTLKNTGKYGVLISNCEGTKESNVQLLDLAIPTNAGQSAIRFDIKTHTKDIPVNRFITIRGCSFPGAGAKISAASLSFIDNSTVELPSGITATKLP